MTDDPLQPDEGAEGSEETSRPLSREAKKHARMMDAASRRRRGKWIFLGVMALLLIMGALAFLIYTQYQNQATFKEAVDLYEARKYVEAYQKLGMLKAGEVGVGSEQVAELKAKIIGDMLALAKAEMDKKNWKRAEEVLKQVLLLEPHNLKADVMRFQELWNRMTYDEAEKLYAQKMYVMAYDKLKRWIKVGEIGVGREKKETLMQRILDEMMLIVREAIQQENWDRASEFVEKILSPEVEPAYMEARTIKEELPNRRTFSEAKALYAQQKYVEAYLKLKRCGEAGVGRAKIDALKLQIIHDLMEMARKALAEKDWTETIRVGQVVLSLEPENFDARGIVKEAERFDVRRWSEAKVLSDHSAPVYSVAYSPDGKFIASASIDRTVKIYGTFQEKELKTLTGHTHHVHTLAFSPDSKTLATAGEDRTIKLWDVESGKELKTMAGHDKGIYALAYSPDGKVIASGSWDHTVRLWDAVEGKSLKVLTGHAHYVYGVAFTPDGAILASASEDKTVKLWNVADGTEMRTLGGSEGHKMMVAAVAFHPDGKILASASEDKTIKLWDVGSGKVIRTLEGHQYVVSAVAFDPDRKTLMSGSWDNTVRFWDVTTGAALASFSTHEDDVKAVAFRPDGKAAASAARDKTVRLWAAKE